MQTLSCDWYVFRADGICCRKKQILETSIKEFIKHCDNCSSYKKMYRD